MKYIILNQGIGVPESLLPVDVEGSLTLEIDGMDGAVVKLTGENHTSYARVESGVATFDLSDLVDRVELSLVRASGSVPLGGLICVPFGGSTRVCYDESHLLNRLQRVERDISDLMSTHRALAAKYDDMIKRIEQLFSGYSF